MNQQTARGRRLPLYGWLTSEAVSLTGTRVSMIAIPWFVLTTTGSATQTGLVAFAEMAPLVALKALAGPLVDRVGARRVAITADVGSCIAVGLVPVLYASGVLSFPLLLALVALAGALRGPGDGAKQAMVPTLVDHGAVPMERATGLHSAVERTASMAGAALAGTLVALVGPTNALLVDAGTFLLSAVILALSTRSLGVSSDSAPSDAEDEVGRYGQRLREGWDFLRRDPLLLGIAVMVAVTNLFDMAYAAVLVPVWAKETGGGAASVGLIFAVFSGASIAGSVLAATWASRLPRYRTYLVAFLLCGAPRFVVLAIDAPLWVVLATAVVGGAAAGFINPVLGPVIFERIPPRLVGRVSSLTTALCWSLIPLGGLTGGLLVGGFGLSPALMACGVGYLIATMLPALQRRWREMDTRPDPASLVEPAAKSRPARG